MGKQHEYNGEHMWKQWENYKKTTGTLLENNRKTTGKNNKKSVGKQQEKNGENKHVLLV